MVCISRPALFAHLIALEALHSWRPPPTNPQCLLKCLQGVEDPVQPQGLSPTVVGVSELGVLVLAVGDLGAVSAKRWCPAMHAPNPPPPPP
jgi:hypothetical protein